MKNGTMYAGRVKKVFQKLRQTHPRPVLSEEEDAVHRLAVALLGEGLGDEVGKDAVEKLLTNLVDWNEIRVSRPFELCRAIGEPSGAMLPRCQRLITVLNAIYRLENKPSLDRLKTFGRREAWQYLEKLSGMSEYAVASVFLWSMGGHAIPVHDALLEAFRAAELVDASATRSEVQAFLERNIAAADAKEFCVLMDIFVAERRRGSSRSRAAAGR